MDNKIRDNFLSDITILINSCDLYKDTWEPFLKLFFIQWPNCPYPVVINSESVQYQGEYSEKVKTILNKDKSITWSQRFRKCLEQINTDFVLFVLDDFFIQNKVDVDVFEHAHTLMRNNTKIGMAALSYGRCNVESNEFEDDFFYSRIINKENLIWCRINLYRKDYLLKLIRNHETIWEFESYASYRAKKLPFYIIQQKSSVPECFTFYVGIESGYGINYRKWLPKNKELFDKYGINVNYDNLGFFNIEGYYKPRNREPDNLIEKIYKAKKTILKTPYRIKKQIRKIKSMR